MEFASAIQSYGTGAMVVVLLAILIMEIRNNHKLLDALSEKNEEQDKKIEQHDKQIEYIKENYATKESTYRQMESWKYETNEMKTTLNRIEERIYSLSKEH